MKRTVALASAVLATGRLVVRAVPVGVRKKLEDRVFGAVFHLTRVTNDAYGWRPKPDQQESDGAVR